MSLTTTTTERTWAWERRLPRTDRWMGGATETLASWRDRGSVACITATIGARRRRPLPPVASRIAQRASSTRRLGVVSLATTPYSELGPKA